MVEQQANRTIPDYPMRRGCPYEPPAEYAELRERGPVSRIRMYDGRLAWLVTRYADVRRLFADSGRLSSNRANPDFPLVAEREKFFPEFSQQLFGLDGDEHRTRQRMLLPRFTTRQVAKLRPAMQRTTDDLIDAMLAVGPPADLISSLGRPLPSMVVAELFGVPYEDHVQFEAWYQKIMEAPDVAEIADAGGKLISYIEDLIDAKRAQPTDDLLSTLVAERLNTGEISRGDLSRLAIAVLSAGSEATASMIGLGVLTLLEHPDQLEILRSGEVPIAEAVDELLRFLSTADMTTNRVATEDVPVGDQTIRAGEGVVLSTSSANHDPAMFPDPDRLDLRRAPHNHLAFGAGPHRCVGEHVGRVELEVVFGTLFRRVPSLRLAKPMDQLRAKENMTLEGLLELPVVW
jgi:pentalenic acid synthase